MAKKPELNTYQLGFEHRPYSMAQFYMIDYIKWTICNVLYSTEWEISFEEMNLNIIEKMQNY